MSSELINLNCYKYIHVHVHVHACTNVYTRVENEISFLMSHCGFKLKTQIKFQISNFLDRNSETSCSTCTFFVLNFFKNYEKGQITLEDKKSLNRTVHMEKIYMYNKCMYSF